MRFRRTKNVAFVRTQTVCLINLSSIEREPSHVCDIDDSANNPQDLSDQGFRLFVSQNATAPDRPSKLQRDRAKRLNAKQEARFANATHAIAFLANRSIAPV